MRQLELKGKVQTVTGIIEPEALGMTLAHEHLIWSMAPWAIMPEEGTRQWLRNTKLTPENAYLARADRFINLDNMANLEVDLAIKEVMLYKLAGGQSIVELSQHGLSRDPKALAAIARATGLNIIMGCGYYVAQAHPAYIETMTEEEIAQEIIGDLTTGAGDSGIRSGIIGEIGCSIPLHKNEKKVLHAAALAQQATGAAINVHPSMDDEIVFEDIAALKEAGAELSHVVISHCDINGYKMDTCKKIADMGCYVEFDAFGQLGYPHIEDGRLLNLSSDIERIRGLMELMAAGYEKQLLISLDICFKDSFTIYGGWGYAHIPNNVMHLMRQMGMSETQVNALLVDNPKAFYPFR